MEAHPDNVVHCPLSVFNHEAGEVGGLQHSPPLQIHLVPLRVQHLVVLPQLPPYVCRTPPYISTFKLMPTPCSTFPFLSPLLLAYLLLLLLSLSVVVL